ncbi:MAG: ATP-binding cassette domain-containing protein [Pseudomonadales bacterium]|nr:ATP-binding cassette domain-containing protein [Pseudomonadales bacterium]
MSLKLTSKSKLPMIFQAESNECGLASLAMISSFHGKQLDLRSIRTEYPLAATGASVKHLLEAAQTLDLMGRALKLELSDISNLTLPAVLHWDLDHFVVLKKIAKSHIVIHDPAIGIRKYQKSELINHFTGIAIEFSPAQSFKQESLISNYSLKDLFSVTSSFKRAVIQVFFLSLLIQILSLLTPLYLQLVIDQGLNKGNTDLIVMLAVLFVFITLAKTAVTYCRGLFLMQFSNQVGFQLVSNVFRHLLRLPIAYFEKREMGDIVSRFSSIESIKQLITQEMITVLVDGLFSLITVALLFLYDPVLAFIAIGFVVLVAILRVVTLVEEKNRRQETLVTNAKQQSRFMENVCSMAVTKLNGIEHDRENDWCDKYANYLNSGYKLGYYQLGISTTQGLLFGLDHITTILFGAMLVNTGQLTIGQLMSFIFLKQHFSSSVTAMLPKIAEIRLMKLELERVADITLEKTEELEVAGNSLLPAPKVVGDIEGENLSFSYGENIEPVLSEFSFKIEQGSVVGITGHSGSGKSSLIKLLLGLEKPNSGKLKIGGKDLLTFNPVQIREQIGAVLHNDVLLAGDLAYNINLGKEPFNEERLLNVCSLVGLVDIVSFLPMGFQTQVGEMGNVFSAGQTQRILIARALYKHPTILVLDEALSNLGSEASLELLSAITKLDITVILVTHNPVHREFVECEINIAA